MSYIKDHFLQAYVNVRNYSVLRKFCGYSSSRIYQTTVIRFSAIDANTSQQIYTIINLFGSY
jgi:hypothetical protein